MLSVVHLVKATRGWYEAGTTTTTGISPASIEAVMTITIYHNPACGTSRNTLAIIRQSGEGASVVIGISRHRQPAQNWSHCWRAMDIPARALLREKGTPYAELELADPKWTDDELIDFMIAHPILDEPAHRRNGEGYAASTGHRKPCLKSYKSGNRTVRQGRRRGRARNGALRCQWTYSIFRIVTCAAFDAVDRASLRPTALRTTSHVSSCSIGSLRERSWQPARQQWKRLGCSTVSAPETRIFNPSGLPLPDDAPASHPKGSRIARACRNGRKAKSGAARSGTAR